MDVLALVCITLMRLDEQCKNKHMGNFMEKIKVACVCVWLCVKRLFKPWAVCTLQALMAVGEAFPAVQAAQKAVSADPTWWEARQTLGRAQLNMGEVRMVTSHHYHLQLVRVQFFLILSSLSFVFFICVCFDLSLSSCWFFFTVCVSAYIFVSWLRVYPAEFKVTSLKESQQQQGFPKQTPQ